MKAPAKILAALLFASISIFFHGCQTFMPSNILDEAQIVKSWVDEAGYYPKDNGYEIFKIDNLDLTKTYVKSYNFGKADDKIVGGSQLVDRIKPINDNVRFECTVDLINDYYHVRVWKSYLLEQESQTSKLKLSLWKSPFISEVYLRIPDTNKEDFLNAVKLMESDFSMSYADFIDYHEEMLLEMQFDEEIEDEDIEQDSVLSDTIM